MRLVLMFFLSLFCAQGMHCSEVADISQVAAGGMQMQMMAMMTAMFNNMNNMLKEISQNGVRAENSSDYVKLAMVIGSVGGALHYLGVLRYLKNWFELPNNAADASKHAQDASKHAASADTNIEECRVELGQVAVELENHLIEQDDTLLNTYKRLEVVEKKIGDLNFLVTEQNRATTVRLKKQEGLLKQLNSNVQEVKKEVNNLSELVDKKSEETNNIINSNHVIVTTQLNNVGKQCNENAQLISLCEKKFDENIEQVNSNVNALNQNILDAKKELKDELLVLKTDAKETKEELKAQRNIIDRMFENQKHSADKLEILHNINIQNHFDDLETTNGSILEHMGVVERYLDRFDSYVQGRENGEIISVANKKLIPALREDSCTDQYNNSTTSFPKNYNIQKFSEIPRWTTMKEENKKFQGATTQKVDDFMRETSEQLELYKQENAVLRYELKQSSNLMVEMVNILKAKHRAKEDKRTEKALRNNNLEQNNRNLEQNNRALGGWIASVCLAANNTFKFFERKKEGLPKLKSNKNRFNNLQQSYWLLE
jgi:hypothetical protein